MESSFTVNWSSISRYAEDSVATDSIWLYILIWSITNPSYSFLAVPDQRCTIFRQSITELKSRHWGKVRGILAYGAGPVLGLASGPLLARAMGPEGRGQFAAIMQPLTLAGAIASIGIPAAVTFFVAKGKFNPKSVVVRGMIISVFFALLAYGALVIYSFSLSATQNIDRGFLQLVWLLVFLTAAVQIQRGYIQGQGRWRMLDLERFVFAILRFIVVFALALIGYSAAEDFAVGALVAFVAAGFLLWLPVRDSTSNTKALPKVPYSALGGYSLSAALGTIAVVANNRLDQVLLPLFSSSIEVGFYAVAVTVAEVPIILGTLASRDALYESSRGRTASQVFKACKLYLIGAVILGLILATLAPFFMSPVFGASFSGAVKSVQILCLGTIAACFALTLTSIIIGAGRPGASSMIPLSGLIATLGLFWAFESSMTSTLAAIIAAVSQIISVLVGVALLVNSRASSRNGNSEAVTV